MNPIYRTRIEASDYLKARGLKVEPTTLQKFATVGGGPKFQHFGNRVVYTDANLDAWAEQKLSTPRRSRKTSSLIRLATTHV